jgi:hypothetical protein
MEKMSVGESQGSLLDLLKDYLNIVPAAIEWFIEDQAFLPSAPSKIVFPKHLLAYKPVQILTW